MDNISNLQNVGNVIVNPDIHTSSITQLLNCSKIVFENSSDRECI